MILRGSDERTLVCSLLAALALGPGVAFAQDPSPEGEQAPAEAAEEPEPIEVTVEGDKAPAGSISQGRKEIREMPGVLGDPYRAVEVEPGVTPVTSGIPFYFIRGAPPGNIGYSFEGISVPLLFHVGPGPSVLPAALIQRVDLHFGPYPASFGRIAGAIIDATSTPPRDEWHGEVVGRIVDVGGMVEGPLPDNKGSLLIGGHYAVGAKILSALVPSLGIDYADYQGRASFRLGSKGRLTLLTFGSYDYLATNTLDDDGNVTATDKLIDSDFHRIDLRYEHQLDDGGKVELGTTFGLDRSRGIGVEHADNFKLVSRMRVEKPVSGKALFRAGLDLALDRYDVKHLQGDDVAECTTFVCSDGPLGASTQVELSEAFKVLFPSRLDLALGAWVDMLIVLGERATITPGLRFDYFHSLGQSDYAIDPKLVGRFGVTDNFRLVPAIGLASQLPGFPPVPGLQIGGIPGGLQRALQTSFGGEGEFGPMDLRATVFRQASFNLTDSIGNGRGDGFGVDRFLNRTQGDAYGLELSARGAISKSIFFLASYTLSRSTREDDGVVYPSAYDRTHVAQLAFLYDLGRGWKAGVRSMFYTGFPADEGTESGERSTSPERVKPFFRLDARLAKRWVFGERNYVGLVFDFQNVTLSREVFDVTCENGECQPRYIGPITIPTTVFEAGF